MYEAAIRAFQNAFSAARRLSCSAMGTQHSESIRQQGLALRMRVPSRSITSLRVSVKHAWHQYPFTSLFFIGVV